MHGAVMDAGSALSHENEAIGQLGKNLGHRGKRRGPQFHDPFHEPSLPRMRRGRESNFSTVEERRPSDARPGFR